MENLESKTTVLNDLIRLNNDRIAGYEKAIQALNENTTDLKTVFHDQIVQSYAFIAELKEAVEDTGGKAEVDETTTEGKLFRSWMDIKAIFTGSDRQSVLESCIEGENAIHDAYTEASKLQELPTNTQFLIQQQKEKLAMSGKKIAALYHCRKIKVTNK
ncbi:hypothetical protein GCM10023231_21430 [Olivibacter ginsenosidimutans]|uniref:DUF2383 domain-containing protein n=1 Tax=Olivibacter ginsenosidimutans TaxID=1176537 RepID=A0ABP9BBJ6_9SPHI